MRERQAMSGISHNPSHHAAHARSRNHDGRFRQKRSDTLLSTLEAKYGEISDRRSDCTLGTIREATGKSLSQLVHGQPEVTHKPGLDGRVRTQNGRIHAKRGDTQLKSLQKTYPQLICSLPGTTPLWLLRKACGEHSLSFLVAHPGLVRQAADQLSHG